MRKSTKLKIDKSTKNVDIDTDIEAYDSLDMTLPLTLATNDVIKLLVKLNNGQSLAYHVTGTFNVDDPFYNLMDFPIDIEGSAYVEVGIDEYFEQPDVTVNKVTGTYIVYTNGLVPTGYKFDW